MKEHSIELALIVLTIAGYALNLDPEVGARHMLDHLCGVPFDISNKVSAVVLDLGIDLVFIGLVFVENGVTGSSAGRSQI